MHTSSTPHAPRSRKPVVRMRTANTITLQRYVGYPIREKYGLSAQLTIRAISKATEAYKHDTSIQPAVRSENAIVYDSRGGSYPGRILRHWTVGGICPVLSGRQCISRNGVTKAQGVALEDLTGIRKRKFVPLWAMGIRWSTRPCRRDEYCGRGCSQPAYRSASLM
mgnify:CR=1 FL=1